MSKEPQLIIGSSNEFRDDANVTKQYQGAVDRLLPIMESPLFGELYKDADIKKLLASSFYINAANFPRLITDFEAETIHPDMTPYATSQRDSYAMVISFKTPHFRDTFKELVEKFDPNLYQDAKEEIDDSSKVALFTLDNLLNPQQVYIVAKWVHELFHFTSAMNQLPQTQVDDRVDRGMKRVFARTTSTDLPNEGVERIQNGFSRIFMKDGKVLVTSGYKIDDAMASYTEGRGVAEFMGFDFEEFLQREQYRLPTLSSASDAARVINSSLLHRLFGENIDEALRQGMAGNRDKVYALPSQLPGITTEEALLHLEGENLVGIAQRLGLL